MNKGLYTRLAFHNIRSQRRLYIPFILAGIGMTAMFYIMLYLANSSTLSSMRGGDQLRTVLAFGIIVVGIFTAVVILYANSFLIKQRKRELGLYNILGMGKRHIAKIMTVELIFIAFISIALGLGFGILTSKLMLLLLGQLLDFPIAFGFEVSPLAVIITLVLIGGVYLVALLWNIGKVGVSKPIELLHGAQTGEREPKTRWLLAIIGILTLGTGYGLAVTIDDPSLAVVLYFAAVILVIIGTYCLFTAGSIAVLKALRKNKAYYYKTRHFTSIAGMIYRMKQNAVGLANICILSTMVLVMISTTVCLYYGLEDSLKANCPRDVRIIGVLMPIDGDDYEKHCAIYDKAVADSGIETENRRSYRNIENYLHQNGSVFSEGEYEDNATLVTVLPLEDMNLLQEKKYSLAQDEVLAYRPAGEFDYSVVTLQGKEYKVKEVLEELNVDDSYEQLMNKGSYFFVLSSYDAVREYAARFEHRAFEGRTDTIAFYYGIDAVRSQDEQALESALYSTTSLTANEDDEDGMVYYSSIVGIRESYYGMYGGLFFLGICLGLVFVMATVLIMYYKQISEGYDDRRRFEIMRQVGMSRNEVKTSIRSQVLTVFFLPLVAAGIHLSFSFPMVSTIFIILGIRNTSLFLMCTAASFVVFALLYFAVYAFTARTYYKIVSDDK